jgi:hypothetical protein
MKATNTSSHRKAEALLRKLEFTPFRQFEPKTVDAIGKGELFEVWQSKSRKLVIVHFFSGDNGFEVYVPATSSNLIVKTEEALAAL